jgi:dolichyl-phosphate beta-glucosyltransferase
MLRPGQCTLVVPLFNESRRFPIFAPEFGEFLTAHGSISELIFVDDGSSDRTPDLVGTFIADNPALCVRLIARDHKGKGAAVAAGLLSATTELAAFCDLDLATPLHELMRIVETASRAPILAIGSRGTIASRITKSQAPLRAFLGRNYNRLVQLVLVPGVDDTQCGAKAAPSAIWQKLLPLCREEGLAWDAEVIAIARVLGVSVQEIGIEWHHESGSRIRPLRDGLTMLGAIPRIRHTLTSLLKSRANVPAEGGGSFDDDNARMLATTDTTHWWFRSKATFVSMAMGRAFSHHDGWLVDVGAGSGGVTSGLGWDPKHVLALERNPQLAKAAKDRHALSAIQSDASKLPIPDSTASVVCLLDVLEHQSDPLPMLEEAARILRQDGCLIVNVPAHPWLWSAADEVLGHARRYNRRALRRDLERGGLEVLWMSHVFSWLVAPVWLMRRAVPGSEPQLGLSIDSAILDHVTMVLTRLEMFVTSKIPFPLGTSILCVCVRNGSARRRTLTQ